MSTVIKVENLSKQYRLGLVGATTFKEDAQRWWANIRGKEDPFLNLAVENDRTLLDSSKFVWSLKDINFELVQGDVLGIIGRNGAGKSTLLKILSKITAPTIGSIKAKGRIASLLEVGTGFHPELTGRENIYLNGAILGMRKHEITRKLDEIIAFAGVERYIDTPVKRYSSGMYVRLAFAVAAHLENEILIIDEVLAVGDADFQKKCLGKMSEVSLGEGRTVLFVSHNMAAIQTLCNKTMSLKNGQLIQYGDTDDVISDYLKTNSYSNRFIYYDNTEQAIGNEFIKILGAQVENSTSLNVEDDIYIDSGICINFSFVNFTDNENVSIGFDLRTMKGDVLFGSGRVVKSIKNEVTITKCKIPPNLLNYDLYTIHVYFHNMDNVSLYSNIELLSFEVLDGVRENGYLGKIHGFFKVNLEWQ